MQKVKSKVINFWPLPLLGGWTHILKTKVFCTDCDGLLQTVLEERGVQPADADVHCGFDGGQGILKIAITATQKKEVVTKKGRSTYDQVILQWSYMIML